MNFPKLKKRILKLLSSAFKTLHPQYWFLSYLACSIFLFTNFFLFYKFHAEVECCSAVSEKVEELPEVYKGFLQSRPGVMEVEAIRLIIELCKRYRYL